MRSLLIALLTLLPLTAAAADFSEAELLAAARIYMPGRYDRLVTLKDTDPEAYEAALETISTKLSQRSHIKSAYTEQLAAIEDSFQSLVAQHAESDKRGKAAIRTELESVATEYFELKLKIKLQRLEAIQATVNRLEAELESDELRRELISERIDKALVEAAE